MAYIINKTDGTQLTVVHDETVESRYGVTLIGRLVSEYGEYYNESMIRLLENSANNVEPEYPLEGQLWYNTDTQTLNLRTSEDFKTIGIITQDDSAPLTPSNNDLWLDTSVGTMKLYRDNQWSIVGPDVSDSGNIMGFQTDTIIDSNDESHVVTKWYVDGIVVAMVSSSPEFTPKTSIANFPVIKPGITFAVNMGSTTTIPILYGTATNAETADDSVLFDSKTSSQFLRSDVDGTLAGSLTVKDSDGLALFYETGDTSNSLKLGVVAVGPDTNDRQAVIDTTITENPLLIKKNGTTALSVSESGGVGYVTVTQDPTVPLGVATKQYVDTVTGNVSTLDGKALYQDGSKPLTGSLLRDAGDSTITLGSTSLQYANTWTTKLNNITVSDFVRYNQSTNFTGAALQHQGVDVLTEDSIVSFLPTGVLYADGSVEVTGVLKPSSDSALDLGMPDQQFATVWTDNVSNIPVSDIARVSQLTDFTTGLAVGGSTVLTEDTVTDISNLLLTDGTRTLSGTLAPETDNAVNLGTPAKKYSNVHTYSINGVTVGDFGEYVKYSDSSPSFDASDMYLNSNKVLTEANLSSYIDLAGYVQYSDSNPNFTNLVKVGGTAVVLRSDIGTTVQAYSNKYVKFNEDTNFTKTLKVGDSDVLTKSDLGETVQRFNANIAKTNRFQIFTSTQKFTGIKETILDVVASSQSGEIIIDSSKSSGILLDLDANVTVKFNTDIGESYTMVVKPTGANTITWSNANDDILWRNGVAPIIADSGYTVLEFWSVEKTKVMGALVGYF